MRSLLRLLLSLLTVGLLMSCSEYDTHTLGQKFQPVNSQVRSFTHAVYVEYTAEGARVWGPYQDEVQAQVNGLDVQLQALADSLVVIAYGYPASRNPRSDGSLLIQSERPYALYLNGLNLQSLQGPAISCLGHGHCYMTLTPKSRNILTSVQTAAEMGGDGCIYTECPLVLGGTGKLDVQNLTEPTQAEAAHAISAASFYCQYKVEVTLLSLNGDGLHVQHSLQSSLGTWSINAQQHGISAGDSLILYSGTYTGSAQQGAYLDNRLGAALRMASLTATSAQASNLMDTLRIAQLQLFDSVQYVWQGQFPDLTLQADTLYQLSDTTGAKITTLQALHDLAKPYLLFSNGKVRPDAVLSLQKTEQKKKK